MQGYKALKTFMINIIFIFTGFTGTLCELLDPNSVCYNNPCQNQGTCHNTISLRDYMCTCKNGFTGKKVFRENNYKKLDLKSVP